MSARFAILPAHAADDPDLSALELRVLIAIGRHLNRENEAWPSQTLLAEKLGKTRESINRAIRVLRERGYLRIQHTTRADGGNGAAVYQVILEPETTPVFSSDAERHRGGDGDAERHGGGDVLTSHAEELPIRTQSSEAKASGEDADLFPDSKQKPVATSKPPEDPYRQLVFSAGLALLTGQGHTERAARAFLGKSLKAVNDDASIVANAITAAEKAKPADVAAWLRAAIKKRTPGTAAHAAATEDDKAAELDRRFARYAGGQRWPTHWGPAPDDPAASYPAALYAKHSLKPWEASA